MKCRHENRPFPFLFTFVVYLPEVFKVPPHDALFRFTTVHADRIYRSLLPELKDEVNPRSVATCWVEEANTLVLRIEAQDLAALRAALNMFLRLVSIAEEMQQIE